MWKRPAKEWAQNGFRSLVNNFTIFVKTTGHHHTNVILILTVLDDFRWRIYGTFWSGELTLFLEIIESGLGHVRLELISIKSHFWNNSLFYWPVRVPGAETQAGIEFTVIWTRVRFEGTRLTKWLFEIANCSEMIACYKVANTLPTVTVIITNLVQEALRRAKLDFFLDMLELWPIIVRQKCLI